MPRDELAPINGKAQIGLSLSGPGGPVAAGESEEEYLALFGELVEELDPRDGAELASVERIVSMRWAMKRLERHGVRRISEGRAKIKAGLVSAAELEERGGTMVLPYGIEEEARTMVLLNRYQKQIDSARREYYVRRTRINAMNNKVMVQVLSEKNTS